MARASERQMDYARSISNVLNIDMPATDDRFVVGAFISKNKEKFLLRQEEMNQTVYARIKDEIRIVDMVQEMGMTLTRKGSYYSTKEHDSIRIKPDENIYFRNSRGNDRRTVIDFVMEFTGKDKNTVIKELSGRLQGDYMDFSYEKSKAPEPKPKAVFKLPPKGQNMRNLFAYLVQTRYLDPEIVQELVKDKMIYQDNRRNCIFVSYKEDEAVFATIVGTNTFAPFKGDIEGSDYTHCWFINNGSDKLFVGEAPIDILSRMTILKSAGHDYNAYDYLALTGTGKYEAVFEHLQKGQYSEVIVGTDNDKAGFICKRNIEAGVQKQFPQVKVKTDMPILTKDWNDELKYLFQKGYRYENYIAPSEEVVKILQNEIDAILQENEHTLDFCKMTLSGMGIPDELQDYVLDYLDKKREEVLSDVAQGSKRSVENIIKNYNKNIKINLQPREPMTEQGIEV